MPRFDLEEDMHIHSVFSDGAATLEEIYEEASSLGLKRICFVDHVRADTEWLSAFVEAAAPYRTRSRLHVSVGVEAKILDTEGRLDLPSDLAGIDFVLAADHQVPFSDGPRTPWEVRKALAVGALAERQVIAQLVTATMNCMHRHPGVVLAHLFSVLPKLGLAEDGVEEGEILDLSKAALETGSRFELSERWSCPSLRVAKLLMDAGVPIHLSTDSHRREDIGRYRYCRELVRHLDR